MEGSPVVSLIPNNQGLVDTTAGNDAAHLTSPGRSAVIRKIMWSNWTGVTVTFQVGHLTNAGVFAPLLPTITCVNGQHDNLKESELPDVEFAVNTTAAPAGSTGNIIVVGSVAHIFIRMTVEERG